MFDLEGFRAASLSPRQESVPVPDLAPFFGGADPVWVVRGLTGDEIARANDTTARTALLASAVEALASAAAAKADQVEALQAIVGAGGDVPLDLAKRFDHLVFGSVAPAIDRQAAVKLFSAYPVVAYQLTNKILELTGLGPDLGKAPHSTQTPEFPPP